MCVCVCVCVCVCECVCACVTAAGTTRTGWWSWRCAVECPDLPLVLPPPSATQTPRVRSTSDARLIPGVHVLNGACIGRLQKTHGYQSSCVKKLVVGQCVNPTKHWAVPWLSHNQLFFRHTNTPTNSFLQTVEYLSTESGKTDFCPLAKMPTRFEYVNDPLNHTKCCGSPV